MSASGIQQLPERSARASGIQQLPECSARASGIQQLKGCSVRANDSLRFQKYFVTASGIQYGQIAAAIVLSIMPTFALALFAQRYLVEGLSLGGTD